jgi:hypothetical protein
VGGLQNNNGINRDLGFLVVLQVVQAWDDEIIDGIDDDLPSHEELCTPSPINKNVGS